ncbi:hypothetical protein ILT44_11765 [Microvirga sp. BT689]|uniref:helix-turn-helix domain-containing protein n=1 Tax=Microvirga arvi TaxID=2778731 RepID=UPI00194F1BB6|nr:hypothetical protein [Microvirga arvi]MBM6580862.1 hypothetical protein [Microvirga arvi]
MDGLRRYPQRLSYVLSTRKTLEDLRSTPPAAEEKLARSAAARAGRRTCQRTGLSQAKFAERFRINVARRKDWEQGRFMPDTVALAYLKVIETDPKAVARALDAA